VAKFASLNILNKKMVLGVHAFSITNKIEENSIKNWLLLRNISFCIRNICQEWRLQISSRDTKSLATPLLKDISCRYLDTIRKINKQTG
jgi:hypothetical protein